MRGRMIQFFSLFTSMGTLLCCALPALIALVAGGAAVSSLISIFPWLVPLSQYKIWIFLSAGILTTLSGVLIFQTERKQVCDVKESETGCEVSESFQRKMFFISSGVLLFATFFTYALTPILRWWDSIGGAS